MTDLEGFLEIVRMLAFLAALIAAFVVWRRQQHGRSSTYVLGAFTSILLVFVISLLPSEAPLTDAISRANPLLIMAFPALLLAFAWSFDARLPGWVRVTIGLAMVVATSLVIVPAGPADERSTTQAIMVVSYLAVWTLLAVLAAARLWTAAGGSRPVVLRLRLLSIGVLLFNLALFGAVFPTPEGAQVWTNVVLPIVSGTVFLLAFAAPAPLRRMWRSESTEVFVEAQRSLMAAGSTDEVCGRVAPLFGTLLGADVAIAADGEQICAAHGLTNEEAQRLLDAWLRAEHVDPHAYIAQVRGRVMLVRPARYAPPLDEEGRHLADGLTLHLALALDRTDLLESRQEALDEAQRAKDELETTVVGLAHDLRNPTTALAGFAHLLATSEDPEERSEMAEHLQASAAYIEALVSALLEVSRIGRTQTESEPVDLAEVARRVSDRWRTTHPTARVEVGELCTMEMNPGRAEQLLDNLVANAIRHGGRDDVTVLLDATHHDGEIHLRVADDGVGIAPEDRDNVFRLFHRSPGASAAEGSGVGLTMVKRIAESYGGSVHLEEAELGASISIHLPGSLVVEEG